MPTFKHPCPHCGAFINRDVAVCPACGTPDPFAPGRCPSCRRVIEDPGWIVCSGCGTSLAKPAEGTTGTAAATPGVTAATPGVTAGPSRPAAAPASPPAVPAPPGPAGSQPGPSAPASPSAAASGSICSGCGAPLPVGARFCTVCGTLAG